MTYRDNVTSLANKHGIVNHPETGLQESDLNVGGLYFWDERNEVTRIIAGKMNRASRLFFEHYAGVGDGMKARIISGLEFMTLKDLAPGYFDELLEDVSHRPLLRAFMNADCVVIYWKSIPDWLKEFNDNDYGWEEILPEPDWPL